MWSSLSHSGQRPSSNQAGRGRYVPINRTHWEHLLCTIPGQLIWLQLCQGKNWSFSSPSCCRGHISSIPSWVWEIFSKAHIERMRREAQALEIPPFRRVYEPLGMTLVPNLWESCYLGRYPNGLTLRDYSGNYGNFKMRWQHNFLHPHAYIRDIPIFPKHNIYIPFQVTSALAKRGKKCPAGLSISLRVSTV